MNQLPAETPHAELEQFGDAQEAVFTWLRETLGTVAPRNPRNRRLGPRRYRLELLAELLDRETFLLATSWLGSGAVRSVNTKRDYADDLRYWANCVRELTQVERLSWKSVDPDLIEMWTKLQKASGANPRTMNRRLSAWSSFIKFVSWRKKDPSILTPVNRHDRAEVDPMDEDTATPILEKEELQRVIEAAETVEEALTVVLIYTLAGRVTESCTALREHLLPPAPKGGEMQYRIKLIRKRGKKPNWPLPQELWDLIQAVAQRHPGAPTVLVDREGRPMDRHAVDRLLTRLGKKAGVLPGRDLTPHVLRASRLTHMHDDGEKLQDIRDYANHASSETTLRYILRRNTARKRAALADRAVSVYGGLTSRFTEPPGPED